MSSDADIERGGVDGSVDGRRGAPEPLRTDPFVRELVERSPEVVVVIEDGLIVYTNPALVRAVGASSSEALHGRPGIELIHPSHRPAALERIAEVIRTNAPVDPKETLCLREDGSEFWVETLMAPIVVDRRPVVVVMGREVSARRDERRRLRIAEEQFRLTFDLAPVAMAMTSLEGRWLQVNQAFSTLLGYSVAELTAMSFQDVTHPDDLPIDLQLMDELRRGARTSFQHAKRYRHRDGSTIDVLLQVSLAYGEDGTARHFIAHVIDTTAQRAAERALRESERRLREVARQVPVGIFECSVDGLYRSVNARWCQITGVAAEDIIGRSWESIVHPDDLARAAAEWEASSREGREYAHEFRYSTVDGRALWVHVTAVAIYDDAGKLDGILGTVLDVSERRRMQTQMLFNDRMASVGTLASGVAHEINNPLAYVTANLDLIVEEVRALAAGLAPERVREIEELANEGRQGAEKVRRIVRGLKTLARVDDEQRVRLDVHSVLDLAIGMVATELRRRARVVRDYQWVPAVEADEARLGQVFINLLLNAAQALPEGMSDRHVIRLVTRTNPAGRVIIEVHDSGAGIPAEYRDHIFDPFFTTRPVGRGIGLGLSICHGIVSALGGEISVTSEPGAGATFTVDLPGVPVELLPEGAPQPITEVRKRDGRILVIDDDPMVGVTLRRVLERDHEVIVVESAREALTLIGAGQRYDVILCDVMMPHMTGIELHGELGRVAPDQQERMIFVTGGTFTPRARAFFDRAPNALIEKPFNLRNLRAVVREQLQLLRAGIQLDQ